MSPHPLLVAILSSLLNSVHGFSSGYDTSMCSSLTPDVGNPETSPSLFSISLQMTKYNAGGEVKVQILGTGGKQVVGFMLQARAGSSTTPIGTWKSGPSQTKTIACNVADDTKTHSSIISKGSSPRFTWQAPADCSGGPIKFHATVAAGQYEYWVDIVSEELPCTTDAQTPEPTTPTPATEAPTPSPETPAPTAAPPTPAPTAGPTAGPTPEPETVTPTPARETTEAGDNVTEDTTDETTGDTTENTTGDTTDGTASNNPSSSSPLAFRTTLLVACYGLTVLSLVNV